MKITKFGQCCLLIETQNKRILTDPGRFTVSQNDVRDVDIILITHEHPDHLHSDSLNAILANNPQAIVLCNSSVGKILSELGVEHEVLEGRDHTEKEGIVLEAYDGKHAEIYKEFGQVQNTGYFIADELFYPGDAYIEPGKSVRVLALPVAGPWCRSVDAISYALQVNPEKAFPVHDAILNAEGMALVHNMFENNLKANGVEFVRLGNDETKEF